MTTLAPSFNNSDNNYESAWANYAAQEAQKQGAIPAHMSPPRSPQAFFEELLPPLSEDQEDDGGGAPGLIEECNATANWESDPLEVEPMPQATTMDPPPAAPAEPRSIPTV
jgi:hypothetical protein